MESNNLPSLHLDLEAHTDQQTYSCSFRGTQLWCYCPKKCHLLSHLGPANIHRSKRWRWCPSSLELWAPSYSFVESSWTFGKTSFPGGWCSPGQITQACGGISILGGFQSLARKSYSVGSSPAGAGCWTRLWRCLPAGIFVICFNILYSFYWSGKYFISTGYKARLFLNIGWIYLLENCSA